MKRLAVVLAAGALLLSGCGGNTQSASEVSEQSVVSEEAEEREYSFFPMPDDTFVGDTMPFYDGGKMNIFYLADQRDGHLGYHPWALMQTEDYCDYQDQGVVLNYGETAEDQDISLGTGCVIKDKDGLYHAFFTGHNDYRDPKEAIMHATSTDMINWTKLPEDTFVANENYSLQDFRDPYVFWVDEEQCYWMLVVTRYEKNGVIAKYTSKDLSKWKDGGVIFTDDMGYGANLECPTLIKYNDLWYLSFSDQWPYKLVHYRVSKSINGPFEALDKDTIDGNGFYAGRMETDGENLYVVGWNPTKVGHDDANEYDWGGSLVTHQVVQQPDGTLLPIVNEKIVEKVTAEMPMEIVAITDTITDTVSDEENSFKLQGDKYEFVQFDRLPGSYRIEADVTDFSEGEKFGIAYNPTDEYVGNMNFVFNVDENTIEFYNTSKLMISDPQSSVDFDYSNKDSIHLTLIGSSSVVSLYVNDEIALTARMYSAQGSFLELFGINSDVKWENVKLYN